MSQTPTHPYEPPPPGSGFGGCWHIDVLNWQQRCGWPAIAHPRSVPVTLNAPPSDTGTLSGSGFIADTPENRAALEEAAIPKCREWREANPECVSPIHGGHLYIKQHCADPTHQGPAPYCCSAYCDRCAGLRALNGDDRPLLPNEWMEP